MPLHFLAISGSLRAASSNTSILRAAALLAPPDVQIEFYPNLGELPHFTPDLEGEAAPAIVRDLRARVAAADGILFCTPEYVHALPGSFKNLLDWLVSGGELWDKPVAILRVAKRGAYADAQLREVLKTLMARVDEAASVALPLGTNHVGAEQIAEDAQLAPLLRAGVVALAHAANDKTPATGL